MTILALEIPYRDPLAAVAPLAAEPGAVLLDAAAPRDPRGRYAYVCARPRALDRLRLGEADPFAVLDALRPEHRPALPGLPPFQTGVVALLGYELGGAVERLPAPAHDDLDLPDLWAARYDTMAAFDTAERRAWVISAEGEDAARAFAGLLGSGAADDLPPPAATPVPWRPERRRPEHEDAVARTIAYIHAGDIFQANITQRFLGEMPVGLPVFDLYRRLRACSPAPFAAWMALGEGAAIASVSPERFLSLDAAGRVETRPIKGTAPRGATPEEDAANAAALTRSVKDRAENLMIVDLLRNDIGRVCATGSVKVPALAALETFVSVHHLVSEVEGRLAPGRSAVDLLRACFPGGSITGAPKVRAMEIIAELEPARRGPYCGSIAWIGADGSMDSSIVIRTLCIGASGRVAAQAGGGIVADSSPAGEYEESLTKAAPLLRALDGGARQ
ncbi:aminodeoxychorismate synthase component I [Caenispirillum salinarum]|uniref:aminodeoxychorismate synthase component I n=1 Tax=Caenispirillum salinarum TaxID=859058 RepID=UPI00384B886E